MVYFYTTVTYHMIFWDFLPPLSISVIEFLSLTLFGNEKHWCENHAAVFIFFMFFQSPNADDGGDYKCVVKNDLGQLQAKLNLNIEAEPATPTPDQSAAGAPTFTEKPKIVTLEDGRLVQVWFSLD